MQTLQSAKQRVQMVARRERLSPIEAAAGIVAETVRETISGGEVAMRKVLAHGCATNGLFCIVLQRAEVSIIHAIDRFLLPSLGSC